MNDPSNVPDDVHAWITLRLHANGALSVAGNIGDTKLALGMIEGAREAITSQLARNRPLIVMPEHEARDIRQHPDFPTRERGDMAPHERGDP
jgi:hypothetical protein